ncbi:hypothetical protein TWF694_002574 [Orbilia ellipsospora]|uniref:S-adenosyl-L-methionine-dependent methyltransferase n=1 Tax=Orbilia ellipsospora TaxID=2528407 RepID=A0AAV9X2F6_9PEZI
MTEASNARFNSEAEQWDLNPDVQSATKSALSSLLERIPSLSLDNPNKPRVLDLGSGTGLLSIALAPYASQILSIDPSTGMISALTSKLSQPTAPKNITPLCALLTSPDDSAIPDSDSGSGKQRFDIIVSNLVLHHIPDLESFINITYGLLAPGGTIALTDFENTGPEARKFHPEDKMEGVERHGILRAEMEAMLEKTGFKESKVEVGWVMKKQVERFPGEWKGGKPKEVALEKEEDKCTMDFNFLVIMGKK